MPYFRALAKNTSLLSSRLYCRPRNYTGSCPESGLAGFTAGGDILPALKVTYCFYYI